MDNNNRKGALARRVAVLAGLPALLLVGFTGSAFAVGTDPTSSLFDGATTSITTTLIPAVVGLILVGTLVWMGIAWFKKAKNKAGS